LERSRKRFLNIFNPSDRKTESRVDGAAGHFKNSIAQTVMDAEAYEQAFPSKS